MRSARTSLPLGGPVLPEKPQTARGPQTRALPPIQIGGLSTAGGCLSPSWAGATPRKAFQGHNALALASGWLEADRGERKPAAKPVPPITSRAGSKSTTDGQPTLPQTSQQRNLRRASFDNICQAIAEKATQKFSNTREAFRFIDEDHDGTISPTEMRYFFRAYDFPPEIADSFFSFLDKEGKGEIPYETFVAFMSPHFNDFRPGTPTLSLSPTAARKISKKKTFDVPLENVAEVQKEFADVLNTISFKVPSKFRSLRHVWKFVDTDNDGKVSKKEMRAFFRAFNLPQEESDKLYERMDTGSDGGIIHEQFVRYLGPYVSPDPTAVKNLCFKSPAKTKHYDPSMLVGFDGPHAHMGRDQPKACELDEDPDVRNELKALMIDIGRKLPLKFKHQRDAFRMLDLQRDGRIKRTEMRGFFRGLGWDATVADRMFDMLKEEPYGEVDFKSFMSHFDRILGPQFRQGKRKPMIEVDDTDIQKEVNDIAHILQDRMTTKYKSVKEAFRAVDLNKDGGVSLHEMKTFFRNMGMSYAQAEKVFEALDTHNAGDIKYSQFIGLFGNSDGNEEPEPVEAQPLWKLYGGAALCL